MAAEGEVRRPDAGPCFQTPAPGEVTLAGRKLVGSAQVRVGGSLLQHGSIILRGDQRRLARIAGEFGDPHPPATLHEVLPGIGPATLAERLASFMRLALGGSWSERGYRSHEAAVARELEERRYACADWTWRR